MKISNRLAAVAGAIAFATFTGASSAQEPALEEIVVTARKVEESLMEAPLAISAMSAATLEKMNLTDMTEIASFTPGFHYVNQVGGGSGRNDRSASSLVFRGLFLGTANQGQSAGGLVFLDGSPILGGQAPALVDMQRVEILKGPQSAYFGRSVLSGAINYVSRDLNEEQMPAKMLAYMTLVNAASGNDEAVRNLEAAKAFGDANNIPIANLLLSEVSLRLSMGDAAGFQSAIETISARYGQEPEVMARLQQMLMSYGLISPDGSPRGPGQPAGAAASPASAAASWGSSSSRPSASTLTVSGTLTSR